LLRRSIGGDIRPASRAAGGAVGYAAAGEAA